MCFWRIACAREENIKIARFDGAVTQCLANTISYRNARNGNSVFNQYNIRRIKFFVLVVN